jgi:phosphatidylinositol glycan class S
MAEPLGPQPVDGSSRITEVEDEEPPQHAVDAVPKKKPEPPPESSETIRIRSLVIASFWAIVIFLGLPIWWKTTAIYRADLPLDQMMDWADGRV